MNTPGSPPPALQTWLVQARPRGLTHEPWRDLTVAARSALQAEAIVRRQGYEIVSETMRVVAGRADPIAPAAPAALHCQRCGYELDGVQVNAALITCPECGFGQVVMVWRSNTQEPMTPWFRTILASFAVVGAVFLFFCALIVIGMIINW